MTVMDYCLEVQRAVQTSRPDEKELFGDWFFDTGAASTALGHALCGKPNKALKIAERLAEKYWKAMV